MAAQPGNELVTDEPPHLADRRLAELRELFEIEKDEKGTEWFELEENSVEAKRLTDQIETLVWAIRMIDAHTTPAAEASEERTSGRPNARSDSSDLSD